MQWNVYDQRFPWVLWAHHPQGGFAIRDERAPNQIIFRSTQWDGVVKFAADHSTHRGKSGIGDVIASATGALGIKKCTPCARRQAELNQWLQFDSHWNPFG